MRDEPADKEAEVVLGEDWIAPQGTADREARAQHGRRRWMALNHSPLARKIITFNLLALVVLVAGVLFLNPFRDSLVFQHERGLVGAGAAAGRCVRGAAARRRAGQPGGGDGIGRAGDAGRGRPRSGDPGLSVRHLGGADRDHRRAAAPHAGADRRAGRATSSSTLITDFLNAVWERLSALFSIGTAGPGAAAPKTTLRELVPGALGGTTQIGESHRRGRGHGVLGGDADRCMAARRSASSR